MNIIYIIKKKNGLKYYPFYMKSSIVIRMFIMFVGLFKRCTANHDYSRFLFADQISDVVNKMLGFK